LFCRAFSFHVVPLSIFSLSYWAIGVLLHILVSPCEPSILCCTSFKVSGPVLRSLINYKLIFLQGERLVPSVNFLPAYIQFSQQCLLKRMFFLHCVFYMILLKIRWE
jgi:hypothetical protein